MKTLFELCEFYYELGDGLGWSPGEDANFGYVTFESEKSARAFKDQAPTWDVASRWQRMMGCRMGVVESHVS